MPTISPVDRRMRVKQVYTELDRKYEEEETAKKAIQQKIAYINLTGYPVDISALKLLPKETAEDYNVVVFFKEGRNLKIGVVDSSPSNLPVLKELTDEAFTVQPFLISQSSFHQMMEGYDKVLKINEHSEAINLNPSDARFSLETVKNLNQHLSTSATEIVEILLGAALNVDASDIHLEPEKVSLKVRFRIDGVLQDVATLGLPMHHLLVSRIKILSKTKLNITTAPQDGSFGLTYDGNQADVRVSVLPSAFGESIVMRLLRQDKGSLQFDQLGIMGLAKERLLKEMQKPNGMVLTTGPTGSGKTTTLYAILNKLNEPGVKIITIEDPVEYKIPGITQTPIDARAGMTFAGALRAILRQDPDIVMIGEMRDLETAEIACQAALTGHIVLSTLHTNDAPGALPRLLDLGVKPFVLAPAINAIIAQRLLRKICTHCKEEQKLSDSMRQQVELILQGIPKAANATIPKKLTFYHSKGCDQCHGLGYKGRYGVYEVFTVSDEIEKLIHKAATTSDIRKQAIVEGMITMSQDGILKALEGITDIEEVFRVTEE